MHQPPDSDGTQTGSVALLSARARAIGSHKSRINFPSVNGLHLSPTCIDGAANPISPFLVRPPPSVVLAFGIRVVLAKLLNR